MSEREKLLRIFGVLRNGLWALFVLVLLPIGVNFIGDDWPSPGVRAWLFAHAIGVGLGLLLLFGAACGISWLHQNLVWQQAIGFVGRATRLRSEQFGFTRKQFGERAAEGELRPFYDEFIPRVLVLESQTPSENGADERALEIVRDQVARGAGVAIIGKPGEGKTAALYRLVGGLVGHVVVMPEPGASIPNAAAFGVLKGKAVCIVLDDLARFIGSPPDLGLYIERVRNAKAKSCVVVCTCRDATTLSRVRDTETYGLNRFFEEHMSIKAQFKPLSSEQKARLALISGHDVSTSINLVTPGEIVLSDAFKGMRERFKRLTGEQQDVLKVLKRLIAFGIAPLNWKRIDAVLQADFERTITASSTVRDVLVLEGFAKRSKGADWIEPEGAYLEHVVPTENPRDYYQSLGRTMQALGDAGAIEAMAFTISDLAGDPIGAVEWFDIALSMNANLYRSYNGKAIALIKQRRFDEAFEVLAKGLVVKPDYEHALNTKAGALFETGRYQESLDAFEELCSEHPGFFVAWNNKANPLLMLDRTEDALTASQKAVDINPNYALGWSSVGGTLMTLGRDEEAEVAIRRALELSPNLPEALANNAKLLFKHGRLTEARIDIDRAVHGASERPTILALRGQILMELGEFKLALPDLERAAISLPDDVDNWVLIATAHDSLDQDEQALAAGKKALALRPDNGEIQTAVAHSLAHLGRVRDAREAFARAVKLSPGSPGAWVGLGNALQDLRRYNEAVEAYQEALKHDPRSPQAIWYELGKTHNMIGNSAASLEAFDKSLELERRPQTLLEKARLLKHFKNFDAAIELIDEVIACEPENVFGHRNRGLCLAEMNRHAEAATSFRQAVELRDSDQNDRLNLSLALSKSGSFRQALSVIHECLVKSPNELELWKQPIFILRDALKSSNVTSNDLGKLALEVWEWRNLHHEVPAFLAGVFARLGIKIESVADQEQ